MLCLEGRKLRGGSVVDVWPCPLGIPPTKERCRVRGTVLHMVYLWERPWGWVQGAMPSLVQELKGKDEFSASKGS